MSNIEIRYREYAFSVQILASDAEVRHVTMKIVILNVVQKKLESSSAVHRLFPSRESTDVKPYREEMRHSRSTGALSNTESAINRSQSELGGQFTRDLQRDQQDQSKTRTVMEPSLNNELHRMPKFSKAENSFRPLFTTYDPTAIRNVHPGKVSGQICACGKCFCLFNCFCL